MAIKLYYFSLNKQTKKQKKHVRSNRCNINSTLLEKTRIYRQMVNQIVNLGKITQKDFMPVLYPNFGYFTLTFEPEALESQSKDSEFGLVSS